MSLNIDYALIISILIRFVFFLICWIVPIVVGVKIAKKKNRNPHWFWFGIIPGVGFWIFIVMLILKPLKICPNCNKKIPENETVCPFCSK